jgi:hypothetical protein
MERASMRLRLPTLAVAALLAASCDSTEPLRPATIAAHTALEQDAVVASATAVPPAVRITTASGKGVPGVEITFAAQSGSTVTTALVRTDNQGVATAGQWTMGTAAGVQELVASTATLPDQQIRFRANAAAAAPQRLLMTSPIAATIVSGATVAPAPSVQLQDQYGNNARVPGVVVTASVVGGGATLQNGTATTDAQGVATFAALAITGVPGTYSLQFSATSLTTAFANNAIVLVSNPAEGCTAPALTLQLGAIQRYTLDASAPRCVRFNAAANAGQQFMLLFENMPLTGEYDSGVFPGAVTDTSMQLTVRARPPVVSPGLRAAVRSFTAAGAQHDAHAWDFGDGPITEFEPPIPAGGIPDPQLVRGGRMMSLQSAAAEPAIGDTIDVWMEGIPRLSIVTGNQKAVIRHISNELIIAEDVRLRTTLVRSDGNFNTPLTETDLGDIAREYAAVARVQGDIVFDGRFNPVIEAQTPHRVLAVHSLMGSDGVWGYTYSTGKYFVWDYWVGPTNGVNKGANQIPQRVADNLFMHEIAHMRHAGLIQRAGLTWNANRGNRWVVEGFARHTERYATSHRLLGQASPSRTANLVLPLNPIFNNSFFRDDVPTFLNGGTSMFGGYQHASFVFDYFMDQVAVGGGNAFAAVRDLVINAGRQTTADAAVSRWLPGMTFAELFTRARIALYLDDIGTAGLPAWTQYHQFRLRESRPANGAAAASDPRNAWPKVAPGQSVDVDVTVANGAAFGVIVDGAQTGAADGVFMLDLPRAMPNAVLSVVRIR